LDNITEFLSNPFLRGAHYTQIEIDLSIIDKLYVHINEKLFNGECKIFKVIYDEAVDKKSEKKINDYFDMCIKLLYKGNLSDDNFIKYIDFLKSEDEVYIDDNKTLFTIRADPFVMTDKNNEEEIRRDYDKIAKYSFMDKNSITLNRIFVSNILNDLSDVIIINKYFNKTHYTIVFETLTIKEETSDIFLNFLNSIPHMDNYLKIIKKNKYHSSKYILQLYPLIVKLWLKTKNILYITKDIVDLLSASIEYYDKNEWRTCIILNSIIVEIILSIIYEEEKKIFAPNITLGALYNSIKNVFPAHTQKCIESLNEIRIAAVHRSKYPVSNSEAINTIYNATSLITWFHDNY